MMVSIRTRVPRMLAVTICWLSMLLSLVAAAPRYDMDLHVDYDAGSFEGCVTVEYMNQTPHAQDGLLFRLFGNDPLFGTASVTVTGVEVQGTEPRYQTFADDTVLLVELEPALSAGGRLVAQLTFRGEAEWWMDEPASSTQGYGLLARAESSMTLSGFYPILAVHGPDGWDLNPSPGFGDVMMAEASDYTVRLTARSGLLAVGPGQPNSDSGQDHLTTFQFSASNLREFSVVLLDAADYTVSSRGVDQVELRSVFRRVNSEAAERALTVAANALRLFERRIAPCPYPQVSIVEVPLAGAAGMEFSGLILVGSSYAAQPRDPFFTIIVAHEMAHQWFYGGVGNSPSEHPWLDEAFATFLSHEYLREYEGPAAAAVMRDEWRRTYRSTRAWRPDLTFASPLYAFPDVRSYAASAYDGGALFLHHLRREWGEDCFDRAVQDYYQTHLYDITVPRDLFDALERACNRPLDDVLIEWDALVDGT